LANVKQGNSHYIDSTGDLITTPVTVKRVFLAATGAGAVLVLGDPSGSLKRFDLRVATSGATSTFEIEAYFPNGVEVTTLTNAVATIVYGNS
jgi:hypothetical protein